MTEPRGLVGAPPPTADLDLDLYLAAFAVATALLACACVAWALWRRRAAAPATDRAFARLARTLRLTAADRETLRTLAAAHGSAEPVALLVSPHALATACDDLDRQPGIDDAIRVRARRILDRVTRAA